MSLEGSLAEEPSQPPRHFRGSRDPDVVGLATCSTPDNY
jgi:hypothetical protein